MNLFLSTWGLIFFAAVMDVIGAYVVKAKINELGSVNYDTIFNVINYLVSLAKFPLVWFGTFLILTAPLPYALALSRMELSTAYPVIVTLNALLLIPIAVFFLNESLTVYKIIGFIIIIIGLYFIHK
tara:strand:- start:40 stop:420 length:381 start_codon:yes stop_codon:yes gene_type:complete